MSVAASRRRPLAAAHALDEPTTLLGGGDRPAAVRALEGPSAAARGSADTER